MLQSRTSITKNVQCVRNNASEAGRRCSHEMSPVGTNLLLVLVISLPFSSQQSCDSFRGLKQLDYALPGYTLDSSPDWRLVFLRWAMPGPQPVQVIQLRPVRTTARFVWTEQRGQERFNSSSVQTWLRVCSSYCQAGGCRFSLVRPAKRLFTSETHVR